ncbi:MAG: hypothetical protein JRH18_11750 [Deltaproteobacteria bacterium]|nr:hypothetical protein [Deltaproteobacteria bacterium]MBW2152332.1 hypothetical protein [Deltaproteobacteria bacterium]
MRLLLDVLNEIFQPKVKLRLNEITDQIGMKKDYLTLAEAELRNIEKNIAKDIETMKTELELEKIIRDSLQHQLNLIEPILSEQRRIIESFKANFRYLFYPEAEAENEKTAPVQGRSVPNFNDDISQVYGQFVSSLSNLAETESKFEELKAEVKQRAKIIDEKNKELMTLQGALKTPLQYADLFPEYLRKHQEVEKIQKYIKRLQIEAKKLQAVKMLKPMRVVEIKPEPPNYVFLAAAGLAAGFIVMVFVVFCIEFINRHRASILVPCKPQEKPKD